MLNFRKKIFLFCIIIAGLGFEKTNAQNPDVNILKSLNPRYPDSQFWIQTSASTYWVPAIVSFGSLAYGVIGKNKKARHNAYETIISVCISTGASEILKRTFNRVRPADRYPNEIFVNSPSHGKSFPSGHTTLAFAMATTLSLQYKKWYVIVPAYVWAGAVSYSRMYLGKHYPSDVLGGAAVGIGGAFLSHWLTKKIFR